MGPNQQCANHKKYAFTLPADEDPLFNRALPLSPNGAKLSGRLLETASELVTATNIFVVKLPHRRCMNLVSIEFRRVSAFKPMMTRFSLT
jgi:hypothetical protein